MNENEKTISGIPQESVDKEREASRNVHQNAMDNAVHPHTLSNVTKEGDIPQSTQQQHDQSKETENPEDAAREKQNPDA